MEMNFWLVLSETTKTLEYLASRLRIELRSSLLLLYIAMFIEIILCQYCAVYSFTTNSEI